MLIGIPPAPMPKKSYMSLSRELRDRIEEFYIKPAIESLKKVELKNQTLYSGSFAHVSEDIISGKIYFKDGYLLGSFSAPTSKELRDAGYKFINGKWKVDLHNAPDIAAAVAIKRENDKEKLEDLALLLLALGLALKKKKLFDKDVLKDFGDKVEDYYKKKILIDKDGIKPLLDLEKVSVPPPPSPIVVLSDDEIAEIKKLPEPKITVKDVSQIVEKETYTDSEKQKIYDEISKDIEESMHGFIEKRLERLQKELEKLSEEGKLNRETIEAKIKREKQIIQNKAEFISTRALNLLRTEVTRNISLKQGITKYRWITRCDDRVRPANKYQLERGEDHRYLHNYICDWDNPPITNLVTGHTAHPAEDYGCRCVAEIVVEVKEDDQIYGKR